jgi:hypothetical protein
MAWLVLLFYEKMSTQSSHMQGTVNSLLVWIEVCGLYDALTGILRAVPGIFIRITPVGIYKQPPLHFIQRPLSGYLYKNDFTTW